MKGRQRIALRLDRGERLLGDENSMIFVNSQTSTGARRRMEAAGSELIRKKMMIITMVSMMRWGLFYVSMQHGGAAAKRGQRQCS